MSEKTIDVQLQEAFERFEKNAGGQISEAVKNEVANALDGSDEFVKAKDFADQAKLIDEILNKVRRISEKDNNPELKSLPEYIRDNHDAFKSIMKNPNTELKLPQSVVHKANLLRAGVANGPWGFDLDGIGQLARPRPSVYEALPKITVPEGTHSGVIRYLDWNAAVATANATALTAPVAEGNAIPEEAVGFTIQTMPLEKIGATLPVTEEFFEDYALAAQELALFLSYNVEDELDNQIINGNGTPPQINGMVGQVPAYVPVASGVAPANLYDLIGAVNVAIQSAGSLNYQPDLVALNPQDYFALKHNKATDGHYQFPQVAFGDDPAVDGMRVVSDPRVVVNTMFVGDSRYARVYEMGGVTLSTGYLTTQFAADYMTLKARKRAAFLIRLADRQAFREVTNITTALTTIGG